MVERYNMILHAHVELDNHYHLLIESPEGNVSQAMQWLNTSYGVWFNVKYDRAGSVFQSRFKSIPVAAFIAKLRKEILKDSGSKSNRRIWKRLLPFEEVVKAVENVKGESWNEFKDRRGDSGRDIVLSIARSSCGLTLRELGERAEMSLDAVSKAASRVNRRMAVEKELKELYDSSVSKLEEAD